MKLKRHFVPLLSILLSWTASAQNAFIGIWNGKIDLGQTSLSLVFTISEDSEGKLSCSMDSPDQGAKGIVAEAVVKNDIVLDVNVPSIGANFNGILYGNSIFGKFSQFGNEFALTLNKGAEKLLRPQTPKPPFPYSEEEVVFENKKAGAHLAGTLTIPDNFTADTPIVIMISGSGLEDRNEEIFEHKPFWVIADYLARKGIASLRYDDRTFGKSTGGDVENATTLDFLEDARSGIEYIKSRGYANHIGALGHSEGANIAFMLGASKDVDFVISLAGVGVSCDEALAAQVNKTLELQGVDQRITAKEYRDQVLAQGSSWLKWFINYNPVPDISACACPVFAINGDKDIQVISSLNLTSISENLPKSDQNFVKEYPSLNHLFQHCRTGAVTEYRTIEETISFEVLEDLASWLNNR